jgi:hypothetical protein
MTNTSMQNNADITEIYMRSAAKDDKNTLRRDVMSGSNLRIRTTEKRSNESKVRPVSGQIFHIKFY